MPSFSYIARTGDGTLEKGRITASSAETAREKLRKQHLMVEELRADNADTAATIGFTGAMPWTTTEDDLATVPPPSPQVADARQAEYVSLTDTLRLFAGWLLAWYGVVYALGSLRLSGKLSLDIPFLQSLFESPLVLRFAFGTFLFLLLANVHAWLGKGAGKAVALGAAWALLMILFHVNA